ncbi:MAG: cytochrome c [Prosthecochloris sp.]|nr:cytochrome c [Prosthecochloris sp.]
MKQPAAFSSVFLILAMSCVSATTASPVQAATDAIDARQVYERHCRVCHTMQPPATTAPPVQGVSARYRGAFGTRDAAVAAMVDFMKAPSAAKSKFGRGAISRFGLMPAMTISDKELTAVSAWIWDQYDPSAGNGNCR